MVNLFFDKKIALVSALLASVAFYEPVPAFAQFGGFGALLGAAMGGYYHGYRGGGRRYSRGYSRGYGSHRERGSDPNAVDTDSASSKSRDQKVFASLAVPSRTQMAVFKSIVPAASLGAVGAAEDDSNKLALTSSTDDDRDYTKYVSKLIDTFTQSEARQRATGEGDITEHAILQAVDDSYKQADLQRFSTFVGENWSLDRLRVMILKKVITESDGMLRGTNKGRVSMEDLRGVISKSANSIYQRLFETSELLAANHSSNLFVQLLYQTHGDDASGEVREGAERMLMRATSRVSGDFDNLIRRDQRSYALNYRKQRIVFDCLSDNITKVTSAIQGIATPSEIDKKIGEVASKECKEWVSSQFVLADNKLKPQDPVPLRVIWSKTGPVDDPSMYSHPVDAL